MTLEHLDDYELKNSIYFSELLVQANIGEFVSHIIVFSDDFLIIYRMNTFCRLSRSKSSNKPINLKTLRNLSLTRSMLTGCNSMHILVVYNVGSSHHWLFIV